MLPLTHHCLRVSVYGMILLLMPSVLHGLVGSDELKLVGLGQHRIGRIGWLSWIGWVGSGWL